MTNCSEYDRLDTLAEDVLANLAQLATLQLDRLQARDFLSCRKIDRALGNTVGKKVRALGALRQHLSKHKCQQAKAV